MTANPRLGPDDGRADLADPAGPAGDLHLGTVVINVQDMERAVGFWTAALG